MAVIERREPAGDTGVPVVNLDEHRDAIPGGPPSFESFFERQHADLFAALWLITRNRQEAEEVSQDAFLRLFERWDRVAAMDDPEGYLYRTAMNAFRSRARRAALALRHIARPRPADDAFAAVERREMIVQALASLTPRERAAVVLTDVLGYSSEEAGRWLRIKPVTVRVLASRGRGRLRQEVSDDDT
jgi:RNA polymerase sigma-70 factor (ECF subfamily)